MAHAMSLAFSSVCIRGEGTHLFVALLEGPPPSELRSCACFPSSVFCLQSACAESFAYVSKRPMFYSTAIALTEERERERESSMYDQKLCVRWRTVSHFASTECCTV
eukprot:RCo020896